MHQGRRSMEGGIYHKQGTIRTNSNVLWTHQFAGNLPNHDEYDLSRPHHKWKYDGIYGWYGHPHGTKRKRNRRGAHSTTPTNCKLSTHQTRWTRPIPQPWEMRLWTTIHRFLGGTRREWHSTNGTRKSWKSTKLDAPTKRNRSSTIPRIHRILSLLHTRILTNRTTTTRSHKTSNPLALGNGSTDSIPNPERQNVQQTGTTPTRFR